METLLGIVVTAAHRAFKGIRDRSDRIERERNGRADAVCPPAEDVDASAARKIMRYPSMDSTQVWDCRYC